MKVLCIRSFKGEADQYGRLPILSPEFGDECVVLCMREIKGVLFYHLDAPFEEWLSWKADYFTTLDGQYEDGNRVVEKEMSTKN